jgi:hypothetical protein
MRRSIQDLVASVDPNVKIEPEVEDVRIREQLAIRVRAVDSTFNSYFSISLMSSSTLSRTLAADWQSIEAETHWKCVTFSCISVSYQVFLSNISVTY